MAAYRYWRLYVSSVNNAGAPYYCIISEMELRAVSGGGDITTPSTIVTADTNYSGHAPNAVVDNNPSTYWQTSSSYVQPSHPAWLLFDFGEPVEIVEYTIRGSSNASATSPMSFDLQASSDGVTFLPYQQHLPDQTGWTNGETRTFPVYATGYISGNAKLDTGLSASNVSAYLWDSPYTYLGSTVPASDGSWSIPVAALSGGTVLVTVKGPSGYQPISHGPITPISS